MTAPTTPPAPSALTPTAAVDKAATSIDDTVRWLRGDQAAIMRQLPEQQSAYRWWMDSGREHADSTITVPAWIDHYYGEQVIADEDHPRLTATASAVAGLLRSRADHLATAPIYLAADPQIRTILVTLANTAVYQQPAGQWPGVDAATISFSNPIPIMQTPAPGETPTGIPAEIDRPETPTLKAVTWFPQAGKVRCMDWVGVPIDQVGQSDIDRTVREHVPASKLPGLLFNGEWSQYVDGERTVDDARRRLTAASRSVAVGQAERWDGLTEVTDPDTLLAPRLAAVTADVLAAGLLVSTERRVSRRATGSRRGRRYHRTVHVLTMPRPGSEAS